MACAWLAATGDETELPPGCFADRVAGALVARRCRRSFAPAVNSPLTSSVGRLFDAVAALCGLRASVNYEGQAAIELEAACDPAERGCYPIDVQTESTGTLVLDPRETIAAVDRRRSRRRVRRRRREPLPRAGSREGPLQACTLSASAAGTDLVVLSGGVFQNRRLLEAVAAGLAGAGLRVLTPERLPANDGGISYGQAAVAARRLSA